MRKEIERNWESLASSLGLNFDPKKLMVEGKYRGHLVRLDITRGTGVVMDTDGLLQVRTSLRISLNSPSWLKLRILPKKSIGFVEYFDYGISGVPFPFDLPRTKIGDREFDKKFAIFTDKKNEIKEILTPEILSRILTIPRFRVQIDGGTAYFGERGKLQDQQRLRELIDTIISIIEQIEKKTLKARREVLSEQAFKIEDIPRTTETQYRGTLKTGGIPEMEDIPTEGKGGS